VKALRLGILGSTRGSNLLPLVAELTHRKVPFHINAVISNREQAGILEKAKSQTWPWWFCDAKGLSRSAYDGKLSALLEAAGVDLVVLIGFMRILSPEFVAHWRHRIINVHPSLLPAYAGLMDMAVHQAVLDDGCAESGCTVHEVSDVVDEGPILVQKRCLVEAYDTVENLKAKVQALEVIALADAIEMIGSKNDQSTH
jgi:phosphoribosylglycinamide formyltransferase-1